MRVVSCGVRTTLSLNLEGAAASLRNFCAEPWPSVSRVRTGPGVPGVETRLERIGKRSSSRHFAAALDLKIHRARELVQHFDLHVFLDHQGVGGNAGSQKYVP